MAARSTITRSGPGLGPTEKAIAQLVKMRLLVGIPSGSTRAPEPGEKGTPINNGALGYILEHGDDEHHLPARPFLVPGVRAALPDISKGMQRSLTGALSGKPAEIKAGFDQAGLAAQVSVKATMQAGPFAPLSVRTIEARARRRNPDTGRLQQDGRSKDARAYLKLRKEGTPEWALNSGGLAKPLLDTFGMYNSVTYIIKDR